MNNVILYVDGSYADKNYGFGILVLKHNEHIEHFGKNQPKTRDWRMHEYIAFLEAVKWMDLNSIDYNQVSIYCDDQDIGYLNTHLHPENYSNYHRDRILEKLKEVCQLYFDNNLLEHAIQCVQVSRIIKLKGHSGEAYQERVDYLAKSAAQDKEITSFDDWLMQGIQRYTDGQYQKHFFPFTNSI